MCVRADSFYTSHGKLVRRIFERVPENGNQYLQVWRSVVFLLIFHKSIVVRIDVVYICFFAGARDILIESFSQFVRWRLLACWHVKYMRRIAVLRAVFTPERVQCRLAEKAVEQRQRQSYSTVRMQRGEKTTIESGDDFAGTK